MRKNYNGYHREKSIRDYNKKFTPTLNNQEEINKFQEGYILPILNHGKQKI